MNDLISLLETQKEQLDSLAGMLESELHLISTRDAEALTRVLQDKTDLLDKISVTDQTLKTTFERQNDPMSNDDVAGLFEQINHSLAQCKFRTEINQKAVEQGQLRLEHLRSLLLESRAKETMTYDKSGKPKGGTAGKGISA
ncbi:flagellar protein FlgN [Aliiglaciecola sp. M165]|uniref:flagellar protein FlgN n=1 Tax=Aliiglaciecola sp. M165 TaxID=2593649 RepID=UPI00117D6F9D|nr:flagellar protein FlgN [Aliiglaciecola sp. M165]TRY30903.1 flagellar protein FlgN [Aliiglaciecola sp. M165]